MTKKTPLAILATLLLSAIAAFAASPAWETDYDAALAKAKSQGKPMMVEFTGSDWCPPCMMMAKKVFSKDSFTKEASADYVLVKLDFPRSDRALAQANDKYAKMFDVTGFPTIVILDSKGKKQTSFIASAYPSVKAMLAQLDAVKP